MAVFCIALLSRLKGQTDEQWKNVQITTCKKACHSSNVQTFFAEKHSLMDFFWKFCGFISYVALIERRKICVDLKKQKGTFTFVFTSLVVLVF